MQTAAISVPGLPLNSRPNGGPRRFADLPLDPNGAGFRIVTSDGWSRYDALILSVRRRTTTGLDVAASYTLSSAKSYLGLAIDESGLSGGPRTAQRDRRGRSVRARRIRPVGR